MLGRYLHLPAIIIALSFCAHRAFGAGTSQTESPAHAALDEFTAEQLVPQRQRVIRSESTSTSTDTAFGNVNQASKQTTELRQCNDGRFDLIVKGWGRLKSLDEPTPENKAGTYRKLWTGRDYYDYHGAPPRLSALVIISNGSRLDADEELTKSYSDGPLDGTFGGDLMPFTAAIKDAPDLRVDPESIVVGGDKCIVLMAKSKCGSYKVCLDPSHGYVVRAAEVVRRGDDELFGEKMSSMKPALLAGKVRGAVASNPTEVDFSLADVSIKLVDGHWIAVSGTFHGKTTYADGRVAAATGHLKRTFETFLPDFTKTNAFIPDFPDGTRVTKDGFQPVRLEWRAGKPQAAIDDDTVKAIDQAIDTLPRKQR